MDNMNNNYQNDNMNFQNQNMYVQQQVPQNQNKNSGLGVAALVLSIIGCTSLIGLILAIVDLTKKDGRKKGLSIAALIICGVWFVIGLVFGIISKKAAEQVVSELTEGITTEASSEDKEKTTETDTEDETEETTEESEFYFKDLEIVTEGYSMKITDWRIIKQGEKGNEYGDKPVIAFWYDTTNTSGKELDPMTAWIYIMEAYQDNDPNAVNKLEVGMLPDDQFVESQMENIKEGGTVQNAVAYELTDLETPVKLTAKKSMIGNEIGSMDFDIVNMTYQNSDGVSTKGGGDNNSEGNKDKADTSFSNNVIVTDDYTITITDYKIIKPGEKGNEYGDKPVIAFWYDTTNTSGKNIDPSSAWIYIVTAVQDNNPNAENKLEIGMLPDDQFVSSQLENIKEGGTVSNAVAYELTDEETPVTLSATNGMLGKKLGEQTFEIK